MTIGFVRIGKVAMATIGTVWTVSNVQLLYKQTKLFLTPSSYTFLFFHVILLSILFQYSSLSSTLKHLLLNIHQNAPITNSPRNHQAPHQGPRFLENRLSRSFSDIWHRITSPEPEKGNKEDHGTINTILESIPLEDERFVYSNEETYKEEEEEDDNIVKIKEVVLEEDDKDTMDDTWKAIMEGKKKAEERDLKKSNTWGVTPTIEQMRGRPFELKPSKSLKVAEENGESKDGSNIGHWGWRTTEALLSRDELNLRAEEFISKIKNNIRLERLESYNLFLQLINRRAN